jgi:glycogen synthase
MAVGILDHFGQDLYEPPVLSTLKRNPIRYATVLPRFKALVTHYHHGGRLAPLVATALVLSRPRHGATLVTVHGHDLQPYLESRIPGVPRVTRWSLERFDRIIAVSNEVAHGLRKHLSRSGIAVLPAYLPPTACGTSTPTDGADDDLALVVAAYDLLPLTRGDLYGLDTALTVFRNLATRYPALRLEIFLAKKPRRLSARRYYRRLLASLPQPIRERVSVLIGHDLTATLRRNVIYIRPTRRDGDAVSIREALAFGTPTVASNVVRRPPGTILVAGHDAANWISVVADTVQHYLDTNGHPRSRDTQLGSGTVQETLALYTHHASKKLSENSGIAEALRRNLRGSR